MAKNLPDGVTVQTHKVTVTGTVTDVGEVLGYVIDTETIK